MPYNGNGIFNRIYNWVNDAANGIPITASRVDTDTDDITGNGLSNCVTRDGQSPATADLPMGTFKHTGVGDPTATTQYMTVAQEQSGSSSLLSGTWTPTDASGAGLSFTSPVGIYRRRPGSIQIFAKIVYPVTANASQAVIGSLPFTSLNSAGLVYPIIAFPSGGGLAPGIGSITASATTVALIKTTGAALLNSDMSTNVVYLNGEYPV